MAKKSAPKRDFMQIGRAIVEQAIGEQMDGSDLPPPPNAKQLAGSKGGKKGGTARAQALTSEQKRQIARKAIRRIEGSKHFACEKGNWMG
jgi:hypothetical protein